MSSPRVPSVRLDDGRYVLPDAVCLWFFRVFEALQGRGFRMPQAQGFAVSCE